MQEVVGSIPSGSIEFDPSRLSAEAGRSFWLSLPAMSFTLFMHPDDGMAFLRPCIADDLPVVQSLADESSVFFSEGRGSANFRSTKCYP